MGLAESIQFPLIAVHEIFRTVVVLTASRTDIVRLSDIHELG